MKSYYNTIDQFPSIYSIATMNKWRLVICFLLFSSYVFTQNYDPRCNTVQYNNSLKAKYPLQRSSQADFELWMKNQLKSRRSTNAGKYGIETHTIPIIFHVIHNNEAIGNTPNLSQALIDEQLEQLNLDFANLLNSSGTPSSAYPQAADVQIQFCAAKTDTLGNCLAEPGINRIDAIAAGFGCGAYSSNQLEGTIKPATQWDPNEYFNVWTADLTGGLLGYAQFPEAPNLPGVGTNNGSANTDGCVILYSSVGSLATPFGSVPYDKGRTLTHEAGHWLGLRHVWGDGNCSVDDFCDDTPTASSANFGCPIGNNGCTDMPDFPDMVENYMDYTEDDCMNTFTADQRDRMLIVMDPVNGSPRRASLSNSTVCDCSPVASFTPSSTNLAICFPPGNIQFTDNSTGNPSSFNWTFSGIGVSPSSSTQQNPIVTVNSAGTLTAELSVSNTSGSHTTGPINLNIISSTSISAPTLLSPINGFNTVGNTDTLSWNSVANVNSYIIEVFEDASLNTLFYSNTISDTFDIVTGLINSEQYFWTVTAVDPCGTANQISSANNFAVITTLGCTSFTSSDIPKTIPSQSSTPTESQIIIPAGTNNIVDFSISPLVIEHNAIGQVLIKLVAPSSTSINLIDEICCLYDDLTLIFDDNGALHSQITCPPTSGNIYQPLDLFSTLNITDASGTWTLQVYDDTFLYGGEIISWQIEVCQGTPSPTCVDGIMNGSETGVDCGGTSCLPCPSCTDGIMNGNETGVDCGGTTCPPCPNCTDNVMNGNETGIDCGGSTCTPCDCDEFTMTYPDGLATPPNPSNIPDNTNIWVDDWILFEGTTTTPVQLLSGEDAKLRAGQYIRVMPNFKVLPGATLRLEIEPCN